MQSVVKKHQAAQEDQSAVLIEEKVDIRMETQSREEEGNKNGREIEMERWILGGLFGG